MVPKRLKESRLKKQWSQKELAEKSEVSFEQISRYESGKRIPHKYVLAKLAKVLNVSVDYLEGLTDEGEHSPFPGLNVFVDEEEFQEVIDKVNTTEFSQMERLLLKEFIELLLVRKKGEEIFSRK